MTLRLEMISILQLGSDVEIKRVGAGKLSLNANMVVESSLSVEKLYIGGVSLDDFIGKIATDMLKKS